MPTAGQRCRARRGDRHGHPAGRRHVEGAHRREVEQQLAARTVPDLRPHRVEPGELLTAILSTAPTLDTATRPKSPEDIRAVALDQLRRAVRTLDRHATDEELVAYKRFVYALAESVAAAHKEGGFLGIGGQAVSDGEKAALEAIAAIFDEPIPVQD